MSYDEVFSVFVTDQVLDGGWSGPPFGYRSRAIRDIRRNRLKGMGCVFHGRARGGKWKATGKGGQHLGVITSRKH